MKTLLVAFALLACGERAWAQNAATPDIESQGARPSRQAARQRQAVQASEQEPAPAKSARIPYDQILQHPDDVQLNYDYARQQVRDGDLKGAAATLDRVLTVNPDFARVRLLLAVVLYRLDDLTESELEFKRLLATSVPDEVRVEVDKYLAAISDRRKKTHLSGSVSAGVEWDSNRNAWPSSSQFLFADNSLGGNGRRRSDAAFVTLVNAGARHEVTTHNEVFGDLNYYRADQGVVKALNLAAYSVDAGDSVRTPWNLTIRPSVVFDHVLLGQGTFLRDYGGDLRLEKKLDRFNALYLDGRWTYEDYAPTASVPIADELRGDHAGVRAGLVRVLSPTMRLDGGVGYERKNAARSFWAYDRYLLSLSHAWLLPYGTFLISNAEVRFDQYRQPDPFISIRTRHDASTRLSFNYGVPLDLLHRNLEGFLFTAGYEYYNAQSNLTNYAYVNNKITGLVTYKWGLGL